MSAAIKKLVTKLKEDLFTTMGALTKKQAGDVLKYLRDQYYNEGVSHLSDEDYDRLHDTLTKKYGDMGLDAVGAQVATKEKVALPYEMFSMDKIKPDKNNLASWLAKYKGKVCVSDKLDGISALCMKKDGVRTLYTRGDGKIGQNISHLLPLIQIGDFPGLTSYAVRGELIVSKANYDKVKEGKAGARQMVSGLANKKTLTADVKAEIALIEFVAYEVIVPEALSPSKQFTQLDKKSTFHTARWSSEKDISIEKLSEILAERKKSAAYEIDGIIVAHDAVYPRISKNPEHAFAFKMSFAEQVAVTEVLKVNWEASKDGYLKPVVNFEPINISGVTIQYATGFNALFIHEKGIGPGAFLEIIRSGDVIPYIREVKSAAPGGPQMPEGKWHWNETHVDAVVDNAADNTDVQKAALLYFAEKLEIANCGEGTVVRLFDAGINTIPKFLDVTKKYILEHVPGFADASAGKLVENIAAARAKATITQWAVGSAVFGRSIGTKRSEAAFKLVPKTLVAGPGLEAEIAALQGWSKESAANFVEKLPAFKTFMESVGVKPAAAVAAAAAAEVKVKANGKLKDQVVLFTGFHPKDLEEATVREGGTLADTWGKKVTILVVKDASVSNEKTKKAAAAGIAVKTADQFKAMI